MIHTCLFFLRVHREALVYGRRDSVLLREAEFVDRRVLRDLVFVVNNNTGERERNVLFNHALNTFYLRL